MVLIAIWPVQKSENAVHLAGHKDSGTKQILREKWRPAGTGFEGSKFRDFSVPPGHMACMGTPKKNITCTSIGKPGQSQVETILFLKYYNIWKP